MRFAYIAFGDNANTRSVIVNKLTLRSLNGIILLRGERSDRSSGCSRTSRSRHRR